MTLVELMIVVVIIGLLATVATFMFSKQARKARAGEVDSVFTEMALKQEAYRARQGTYYSGGSFFPAGDPGDTARAPTGTSSTEQNLRLEIKSNLYCSYLAGSSANPSVLGSEVGGSNDINVEFDIGPGLSIEPPTTDWYVNAAICDFDGNEVFSYYAQLSWTDQKLVSNPGE